MWQCKFCDSWNPNEELSCPICDKSRRYTRVLTLTKKKADRLGLTGDIVIPEQFNVIGKGAFKSRTDITSVILHSAVKKISQEAFLGCINLKEVKCLGRLSSIGQRAFGNCLSLSSAKYPSANRYTAKDAFFISLELSQIDNLIVSLNKCIPRYRKIELSQRNRGANIQKVKNKITALTAKMAELELFKTDVARGIADPQQTTRYVTMVSLEEQNIARCENEENEKVCAERERARRIEEDRVAGIKKKHKRNLTIGISVGGAAVALLIILLIMLL